MEEFGYSTDGRLFYGRYLSRQAAVVVARGKKLVPTHTAMRKTDGERLLQIIPTGIEEVDDFMPDAANTTLMEAERLEAESTLLREQAEEEARVERQRLASQTAGQRRADRQAREEARWERDAPEPEERR